MLKFRFFGGIGPVAQRELREGARRPVNHRLRFLSAVVGALLLWRLVASFDGSENELGGYLLINLHSMVLWLIFVIVPGLAADCIAREKREGTLGLLFLTPLSAGGIVAGKALVQALRAFTLWLAVLLILVIPFTAGGITWFDAFTALSLEFCAMVLCLAAGLLASSLERSGIRPSCWHTPWAPFAYFCSASSSSFYLWSGMGDWRLIEIGIGWMQFRKVLLR